MSAHHPSSRGDAPELQRQLLARAARLLASAGDFHETLLHTIAACLPALGDFGFLDVVQGEGVRRTAAAHEAPAIEALLASTQWVRQDADKLSLCALSSGEPALHDEIDDAWYCRVAGNEAHLALMRQLGFRSMITVPVRYRDQLMGALTLFMGASGRRHSPQDLDIAAELALLAAPLVMNARLFDQHREAEAALRTSEERLRMAVDAGQVGIWDWDMVRNEVTWSHRIYEMHEVPQDSEVGGLEGFRSRVHPEDLPRVEADLQAAIASGRPYATEFRTGLPDGRLRWIATRGHLMRDADGRPLRMVGASTDITQRMDLLEAERKARETAERASHRLELLAQAGAELSGSLDIDETLKTIAATIVPGIADWCRIDQLDEHGVLQRRLAHHRDPQRAEQAMEMARRLRAAPNTQGSMAWVIEHQTSRYGNFADLDPQADPDLHLYTRTFGMGEHYIIPLVARGRTIGAMAVIQSESGRDIGPQDRALVMQLGHRVALALDNARLYAEAESARRQAESANRSKDEFMAMLGHELRNPLAPISTALELMNRKGSADSLQERRIIGRQVAHLSRLIDDLLDVSRITQGKVQLRREPVDMKSVVAQAVEQTRPLFERHLHPLALDLPPGPALVEGDAVRLTQVVCNLLVNAGKFTPPEGQVGLSLRAHEGRIELAVQDSGCGIAPDLLPRVFDLFVQGQQGIERQSGGLGLGLPIVRTLVEMHAGTVQAQSEGAGRGSRFVVQLPASDISPQPGLPAAPNPAVATGRILVVDDNQDAAQTLSDLLRVVGYEVRCAGDGKAAIALLDEYRPELALLDIGLPGIDGYQLAGQLRADARAAGLKLVALTGYGRDNDRARALAASFDEHLVKPVALDKLLDVLGQLMPASAASG